MKTTMTLPGILLILSGTLLTAILSCKKETSTSTVIPPGKQSVAVYLNDDPVPNLFKVLIDIRYIEVKVDTGTIQHNDDYYNDDYNSNNDHESYDRFGKWDTLSITPRVYDLLKLKNGVDTLIANSYANTGKITKIRITLGPNNVVWTDSTHSYPLTLCDNHPYVYVRVNSNTIDLLPNGQIRIRIDLDVARSVELDNGTYCFQPKLKCYSDNTSGKIEGIVKPREAQAMIKVYNSTDTAYAIPEEDGEFKIRGLKPSVYVVLYKATLPYRDTIINNVQVTAGQKTTLPFVTLHQ
ncbi:MAG TPA: DUF4382 domain-containing protein [Chitinophagaceae bacterium]|nr:DUF4382 domain-containing protein [Chitinophagaceae bacterium]